MKVTRKIANFARIFRKTYTKSVDKVCKFKVLNLERCKGMEILQASKNPEK